MYRSLFELSITFCDAAIFTLYLFDIILKLYHFIGDKLKKIFLTLLITLSSLSAELNNEYLSKKLLYSKIPIVDIRTVGEWKETGILKDSITIQFFTEQGNYNIPGFLEQLNTKLDTTKPFALVCRTGSRTKMVAQFLSDKYNYKVTNITGGIMIHGMDRKDMDMVSYK